jgi:hypothetical protein
VSAHLRDLLRGQALSCRRCAATFRPVHGSGDFGIDPQACRNIGDGIPGDEIRSAALDELHRYPDWRRPFRHRVADTLQGTVGLWIPVSNSRSYRSVPGYAGPLGHALRRQRDLQQAERRTTFVQLRTPPLQLSACYFTGTFAPYLGN